MAKYFKEQTRDGIATVFHSLGEQPVSPYTDDYASARVEMEDAKEIQIIGNSTIDNQFWEKEIGPRSARYRLTDTESAIDKALKHEPWHVKEEAKRQQRDTPQMFMRKPAEITGLWSDPSMKHTVGTLLGLALERGGPGTLASDDLSQYSSRVVQRGIDAGVVQGHPSNPDAEETNHMPMIDRITSVHNGLPGGIYYTSVMSPVSSSEVDDGRRLIRQALRGEKRQRALSPQFAALQEFESQRDGGASYNPNNDPNAEKIPGMD